MIIDNIKNMMQTVWLLKHVEKRCQLYRGRLALMKNDQILTRLESLKTEIGLTNSCTYFVLIHLCCMAQIGKTFASGKGGGQFLQNVNPDRARFTFILMNCAKEAS